MSLFLKHLIKSIKRKPLQPLVLILTITLSIFVIIASLSIKDSLLDEARLSMEAQYGKSDIVVSLNSTSKSRFMFTKDVEEILGNDAKALGTYEIILSREGNEGSVFAIASDFYNVGSIFDFSFTSYGKITRDNLSTTALISESFAKENSLRVGDSFNVKLFSKNVSYTVEGISKSPYLGKYNVMIDITSVTDALKEFSILASALGEDFKPSSTLYVDVLNEQGVLASTEKLRQSPAFLEKSFTDVKDYLQSQSNVETLNIAIDISIIFICLLAMAVSFCCFYILANERCEENASFKASGTSSLKLNAMQYLEVVLYWLVGSVIGILASCLALPHISSLVGLRYSIINLRPLSVLGTCFMVLVSALATVTVFIISSGRRIRKKAHALPIMIATVLTAVFMVLEFIVAPQLRLITGTAVCVLVLLLTFALSPYLLRLLMALISKGTNNYAIKNVYSVKALHNVSRLISVLIAIVVLSAVVIVGSHGNIKMARGIFDAEYAVLGATERCEERLNACDEIKSVEKVYFSSVAFNEHISSTLISVSDIKLLSNEIEIANGVSGNKAIISKSIAKSLSLGLGDSLTFICDNEEITLIIEEIKSSSMSFVIFDCASMGIQPNMLIPVFNTGVDSYEGVNALSTAIAEDVAVISRIDSLLKEKTETVNIYLTCGYILLTMIVVFSLIGLIDSMYNSYKSRKNEFSLFKISGMSRCLVLKMKLTEIMISIIFGIIVGVMCASLILPFMNESMTCLGTEILTSFLSFFK